MTQHTDLLNDATEILREYHDPYGRLPKSHEWAQVVAKLLAALQGGQANAWQLIDTAPKDGTRILLTNKCLYASDAPSIIDDYWYQDRVGGGFDEWHELFEIEPTHWMPLPPIPQLDGEAK